MWRLQIAGTGESVYVNSLQQQAAALGKATVKCTNGHIWTLDLGEVTHRWLVYGDYEGPLQMNWLRNWLSQEGGGVSVDSGANIGQYVVSLSHLPGVQTFAFVPKNIRYRQKTCQSKVICFGSGLL